MYINNKTVYSLQSATTQTSELINFAKENNLPAIGICDIETIQGIHSFTKLASEQGVKAIIAVDTFVIFKNKTESVLLICKNEKSLYEINKALSMDEVSSYDQFKETIIIFKNPEVGNIDNKDYLGVTRNYLALNEEVSDNMILIEPSYFTKKEDFEFFQITNAIKENVTINRVHVRDKVNDYLKLSDNEMWYYPKLYSNYEKLINTVDSIKYDSGFKLPHYTRDNKLSNADYLKKLSMAGLNRRLENTVSNEYLKRLNYELEVIVNLNFVDYFLIVWDIVKYCRKNDIYVGPGRGSAAGSLLSYCLGITSIDPIKYGLIFERFLNPMRKTMPDIDLDIEDTKREEVIDYLIQKYGEDYAFKIGTLNTFQAKSSFREVAKAIDLPKTTIDSTAKMIDSSITFKQNILTNKKLSKRFATDGKLQYILDYIYKIEGVPRNKSIHAAGIIISDLESYQYTSLTNHVSDVDSKTLEAIGLVKFDILAIANLRHLHNIEESINKKYNKKLNFNYLDMKDKEVFHAISDGQTNFVFQLESTGMINVLKKYRPSSFEDVAAILALYRPGPMQYIDEYIARKNGQKNVDYIDQSLKIVLEPTYGIIVYQEQIMEIVRIFAGYDLGKADIFRRAISKKDKDILEVELDKFIKSSIDNRYNESIAKQVAERISSFANYGFNKSHAFSYAKISYASMYYKVNYPDVYFSYYINILKSQKEIVKFEQEIKYLELEILPPNVNAICLDSVTIDGKLQLGLNNINGLDLSFKKELVDYIKSNSAKLTDIVDNCIIPHNLSNKEINNLICSGIFSNFGYNEKTIIDYILSKDSTQDKDALFFLETVTKIEHVNNYDLLTLEKMERDSLNLNIKYNSYQTYFDKIKVVYPQVKALNEIELNQLYFNFDTLVEIIKCKEIKTKNGKLMAFLDCKVDGKEGSITVFPESYQRFYDQIFEYTGYALVNVTIINNGFKLENIKILGA